MSSTPHNPIAFYVLPKDMRLDLVQLLMDTAQTWPAMVDPEHAMRFDLMVQECAHRGIDPYVFAAVAKHTWLEIMGVKKL